MTRVAVLDCGTNSLRLLVADIQDTLQEVTRQTQIVRLGAGVDANGCIDDEARSRAAAVCREYAGVCEELKVERVRFVATSAARDAANMDEVGAQLSACFPGREVPVEVIGGKEEAELSFLGATAGLAEQGRPAPYLVVDHGGGSTEFVRGDQGVEQSISVDLGSVRLFERHLHSDPPTAEQIAAAAREIDEHLDAAQEQVRFDGVGTLLGLAGTVTTLTAHALKLDSYDRNRVHGANVPLGVMLAGCDHLLTLSTKERAELPYMHPGRADVIAAGALTWSRIVRRVVARSPQFVQLTSESDLLDGAAWRLGS
ncbi:Ppx/GppA phosphatase family protein [Gephyromycinifex aptenodytis]|uniref:Ppx/GppA phosphatase family protein n=1 Tax=Gephyromycinifex aptenodytis TaxID=2716227 RepID=UPI001446CC1E|nr:Ppx/GppA phosphatase family protein [Gephyromycinifex aptenodytis]